MQRHFVEIEGARLSYLEQGRGFPVVLGHSYLWDAAMWEPQIEALSRHFRVLVPELWGHGQSEAPPAGTDDLASLARQYVAFLDALQVQRCHLVGLSVGGMWGAHLALAHPERVDRLVLMDTYLGAEPETTRLKYFALLDAARDAGEFTDALLDIIVPIFFRADGQSDPQLQQRFRAALKACSADTIRRSVDPLGRVIFGRDDALAALAGLPGERCLVLCGDQDIPRPPAEASEMAEIIGCDMGLVPNAGHISSLDNPQAVTEILLEWLPQRG